MPGFFAAEAVQQHHQGHEQPRHQADEAVIMRQIAKAGAMLTADPVEVDPASLLQILENGGTPGKMEKSALKT